MQENETVRAIFIRHGQSTGNAGIPCHDLASLELTELGWEQARSVAAEWEEAPTLIVTSPYLRTQQTARPTTIRFPGVPVETWPVQEFTYLQPSRWNGTLSRDRLPHIERYWHEADPAYCDGEGAESFRSLLGRADAALERLKRQPDDALVYVFSHGQFIQAVRALVVGARVSERAKMQSFWKRGEQNAIRNGELVLFDRHIGDEFASCSFVTRARPPLPEM